MSRKNAREYAYQLIFGYLFTKEKDETGLSLIFSSAAITEQDKEYINAVYDGVIELYDKLEQIISRYSNSFKLARIYKVDLATMLLATYEMIYRDDIPRAVSISEAICLVKVYSTQKSSSYVNGVLAAINKDLEAGIDV